jgi:glutamate 5-kinase
MSDPLRHEVAKSAHTLVVKVGTRVLTHADGQLNEERITQLAEDLSQIKEAGRHAGNRCGGSEEGRL